MALDLPDPDELITVAEFARRYRVDPSVVRMWVKTKAIEAVLVGPRKMRLIRPAALVRPIEQAPKQTLDGYRRERLTHVLIERYSMPPDQAKEMASGMNDTEVMEFLEVNDNVDNGLQQPDAEPVPAAGAAEAERGDAEDTGHLAPDAEGEGRSGGPSPDPAPSKGRGSRSGDRRNRP